MNKSRLIIKIIKVIIILLVSYSTYELLKNSKEKVMSLRVAFPSSKSASSYEPTRIHLAPEYIFLENIYSTLVEYSPEGELVPAIAKRFEWVNNEAHFTIREDLVTANGNKITAEDAAFSLKRVILLTGNTHGNLKEMLCPDGDPKTINDSCFNIEVKQNKLILKPQKKILFLFSMLTAIDFAIIPESSVDKKDLSIKDYQNTSGVYYVSKDDPNGNIELEANKKHFNYNDKIPSKIILIPTNPEKENDSVKLFDQNKVDMITTIDAIPIEKLLEFAAQDKNSNLHKTMKIRTYTLTFSDSGMKKYSQKKRISIGKAIRASLKSFIEKSLSHESTIQFFPMFGEGGLKDKEMEEISKRFAEVDKTETGENINIVTLRLGEHDIFKKITEKAIPGISVEKGKNAPRFIDYTKTEEKEPDIFLSGPDAGFLEDIGLISYSMSAGFFDLSKEEGTKWINKYTDIEDKSSRIKLLKDLHFKTLISGRTIPISVSPYAALVRKPWKIGLSKLYANNQFWLIKR